MVSLIQRITLWLITAAILSQSAAYAIGIVDIHVYDPAHVQTEHDHSSDKFHVQQSKTHFSAQNADNHNDTDCHHCDHCSGNHLSWVGNTAQTRIYFTSVLQIPHKNTLLLPAKANALLRPPNSLA